MKPTKEQYRAALQALIERRATLSVPPQETDPDLVVSRYVMGLEDEVEQLRALVAVFGAAGTAIVQMADEVAAR